MAKELVILSWCDVCQDEEVRTEGRSYTLGIGSGKLLEVELCERHGKPVEEVMELLADHGKPPSDALPAPAKRTYKKREPVQAAVSSVPTGGRRRSPLAEIDPRSDEGAARNAMFCVLCAVGLASDFGYKRHLNEKHGLTSAPKQSDLYGGVCPACGEDTGHIRALSNHATNVHDLAGPVGRLFALHADDDKYGAVAAARERLLAGKGTLL